MVPVVWVIRNTYKHGPFKYKDFRKEFERKEAFWDSFHDTDPDDIRRVFKVLAKYPV